MAGGDTALKFHVPEPEVRPGGTPDFSKVPIPKAGSVARPPVDVDPKEIRDLAYSIIRVLNREGEAVGEWAGTLSDEELAEGLKHMMTLRAFDARMLMAQRLLLDIRKPGDAVHPGCWLGNGVGDQGRHQDRRRLGRRRRHRGE